jgi:hypothetical protein
MRQGAFQVVSRVLVRPVRRRRRRVGGLAIVVAGVAAGAGAAGCSQPAEPPTVEVSEVARPPAEPSPSATPEQTPEPVTEPVPPPEMERGDEVGAIAAAEYFMRLSEYAFLTGDLATWNAISTTDCGYCRNVDEAVRDAYASGGYYTGGALDVRNGRISGSDPAIGVYAVVLDYDAAPAVLHDEGGGAVEDVPAGTGAFLVEVIPADAGWRLIEAGTTERSP